MSGTDKTVISRQEYYQITGLLLVGQKHQEATQTIINALCALTGEDHDYGHCADAMYQPYTADELLKKMKLTVSK